MMNETWKLINLKCLQFELSSHCQASCQSCSRPYDYSKQIINGKKAKSWDLDIFKKHISADLIRQVSEFFICGNYGDPLFCKDLELIIEYSLRINPRLHICIHTNGGAGTVEKWKALAQVLKNHSHNVKFSIDGLEDTNAIYRRGVDWNQIISNATTFINEGGRATWKFIPFYHNKHQIDEAKLLSRKMGFKKFEIKKAHEYHLDYNAVQASELSPFIQKDFSNTHEDIILENIRSIRQHKQVECTSLKEQYLYFDADQRVWPCCWLSQEGDIRTRRMEREIFHRRVYDKGIDTDFNSLQKHTLQDILDHEFYKSRLKNSWTEEKFNCGEGLNACYKFCSKNQNP